MSRPPVRLVDWGNSLQAISCPNCNEDYMHQSDVAVFVRGEDGDSVKVITVSADGGVHEAVIDNSVSLNPSRRRHGLRISFWCEHCSYELSEEEKERGARSDSVPDLAIFQEKGITYIQWVD